jgi:pyridoxine kinase
LAKDRRRTNFSETTSRMPILSIQSAVAHGHVGNAVAVPALQALGHEVWRVDTVAFSNHPGRGPFAGDVRPAGEIADILRGIEALGVMPECDAILSGYLGEPETGTAIAAHIGASKHANSDMLYVLDPVIGDDGRVFVRDGVLEVIRDRLLPLSDIVLPNPSELSWLTGAEIHDLPATLGAAQALLSLGPRIVVVTGVEEGQEIASYAVTGSGVWRSAAKRRERRFNGTGDLFAALFTGWYTRSSDPADALAATVDGLDLVTGETERRGSEELAIIPALPKLARAGTTKQAEKIA